MCRSHASTTPGPALSVAAGIGLILCSFAVASPPGQSPGNGSPHEPASPDDDAFAHLPRSIELVGVVRDFRERQTPGGHPDFEFTPVAGYGHYMGNVATELDDSGKPMFTGAGRKVVSQWTDNAGRPIHPSFYDPDKGDSPGSWGVADAGGITSAATFRQWFRDAPGVNMSGAFPITLTREPGSNTYVFDDRLDTHFADLEGFYIVNNRLFGNSQGGNRNYHFTYELDTRFEHKQGAGQAFTFNGDDDVWVFIDGRLVIDIGGVHDRVTQTVHLDRLGLEDGKMCRLQFFYAERHRPRSNFRIETTINLRSGRLPPISYVFD